MSKLYRDLRLDRKHPWRHNNLGRLLLGALTRWEARLVIGLQAVGFEEVRVAHMGLLRHLDVGGTRITEIAERAGITKQAIGQLITACEKLGLVTTIPDPTDGRAKLVLFTDHGRELIIAERSILDRIERETQALLGRQSYAAMRKALDVLIEQPLPTRGPGPRRTPSMRGKLGP